MRTFPILSIALFAALAMSSCSKEDVQAEEKPRPRPEYAGKWKDVEISDRLSFFSLQFFLSHDLKGQLDASSKEIISPFPPSPITWDRLASDSVRIRFELPDYPQDTWEIRAITNTENSLMSGVYFRVGKADTTDREEAGVIVLKRI
ncbi:MAG TPA: hypothetical protein VFR58_00485 [Flavisolibacter sp.]|nr:hypothetical protein [Flavisolibacter sp.]